MNDVYVTESDAKDYLDSLYDSPVLRTEYFQNWVTSELLYQKAEKEGITHDKKYQILLDRSKKEIAASLLLKKVSDEFSITLSDEDIQKYYDQHTDYFRINDPGYLYDAISFKDEQKALAFRKNAISRGWSSAVQMYRGDSTLLFSQNNIFRLDHQIESGILYRVFHYLNEDEISLVLSLEQSKFLVVRMRKLFVQGSTPPLSVVKSLVESRLLEEKRRDYLTDYIKKMYAKNVIDIKVSRGNN